MLASFHDSSRTRCQGMESLQSGNRYGRGPPGAFEKSKTEWMNDRGPGFLRIKKREAEQSGTSILQVAQTGRRQHASDFTRTQ